jgi:predicted dehydrogenase
MEQVKWGIIGTGNICRKFAQALAVLDDAELVAVASRTAEKAQEFAEANGAGKSYGSYDELVNDPSIEVIYVGTPHAFHAEHSMLAMNAGKAVLCEKPFAINSTEVGEMVACAKKNDVFLMEAMWTWCFPAMSKLRELISSGAIGEVRQSSSSFCFRAGINPEGRLFNPALGGGALLDVGVYTTAFAHFVHGEAPYTITALADIGETGVDEQTSVVQRYDNGALATHTCAVRTTTRHSAEIYGTEGWIEVPAMFWQPQKLILHKGGESETFEFDLLGNGMTYEAQEVMACLRAGSKESNVVPLDTSVAIMATLDRIRKEIGLTYPMD